MIYAYRHDYWEPNETNSSQQCICWVLEDGGDFLADCSCEDQRAIDYGYLGDVDCSPMVCVVR